MKPTAKDVAAVGLMTALLIGGQLILSAVSGVEIVTVLLLCFSYSFGWKRGMAAATAFSLLRCFLFGFFPSVIVLYLIYYNVFAFLFGFLGNRSFSARGEMVFTDLLLALPITAGAVFLSGAIKISPLLREGTDALATALIVLCALAMSAYHLLVGFFRGRKGCREAAKTISVTALAAVCTISFSLLDDVITPIFYGYGGKAAIAYFYTSFLAMLPQTVCTVLTVGTLFLPLTKIFDKAAKKTFK